MTSTLRPPITRLPVTTDPMARYRSKRSKARARLEGEERLLEAAARAVGEEALVSPYLLANVADERRRREVDIHEARSTAASAWSAARHQLAANGHPDRWLRSIPAAREILADLTVRHLNEGRVDTARVEALAHELLGTTSTRLMQQMTHRLARQITAVHDARVGGAR